MHPLHDYIAEQLADKLKSNGGARTTNEPKMLRVEPTAGIEPATC